MILVIPVEVNGPLNQFMWKCMEMHLGLDSALPNSGYPLLLLPHLKCRWHFSPKQSHRAKGGAGTWAVWGKVFQQKGVLNLFSLQIKATSATPSRPHHEWCLEGNAPKIGFIVSGLWIAVSCLDHWGVDRQNSGGICTSSKETNMNDYWLVTSNRLFPLISTLGRWSLFTYSIGTSWNDCILCKLRTVQVVK